MKYVLALALAIYPAVQQPTPTSALRFDWPVGVTARVDTDYSREHRTGAVVAAAARLHLTHRMRVLPHAEGLRIVYDNHSYVDSSGNLEQSLIALLPLWIPTTIVSRQGQFVRIENAEQVQQTVVDMFEPRLRSDAAQTWPAFRDYAQRMTSDDALKVLAATDWEQLVGRWIAFPVTGSVTESSEMQNISRDVQVPSKVSTGMLQRVPCTRGQVVRECGVYEKATRIEPDGLAILLKSLMQGVTDPALILEWRSLEKAERVTLEFATMLPHEYTITRTSRQVIDADGQETTDIERIHSVFTYVDEP